MHVLHAVCTSDDTHVLASDVEEGTYEVVERVATPAAEPASGSTFESVFEQPVKISDAYPQVLLYQ
jgi:hypothetical protein